MMLIALVSLTSCKKKYCYQCSIVSTIKGGGANSIGTSQATYCDKTQDEINQIQKDGTRTATAISGGVVVTQSLVTSCNKQ